MPTTEIAAPIARPAQDAATEGWIAASGESAKTGSRNLATTSSTPGTWIRPPNSARKPSTPIATFIGQDCSAMWCSAPGKPTSASSASPVAGLTGSAWATWPVSISSRASLHGAPGRTRKTSRKV